MFVSYFLLSSMTSSHPWKFDVFPSFRGEDVRQYFISHLLKELERRKINTFIDDNIEKGCPIGPTIFLAIKKSRISIVVFSKNYASSTWCLNELVEIHKCYEEFYQIVIPIFHNVDPSDVRKQTGEFGKVFGETCGKKTEQERQRWMRALTEVANLAGEDFRKWRNEADMVEQIVSVVSKKLVPGTGSTNGQCSYSQSRRNTNAHVGKEKIVNDGIRIQSLEIARALAASCRRVVSNNVDKSLASPLALLAGSTNGQSSYSQSQRNTNASIKEDKLVNEGIQIQSSPLARALAGSRRPSQIRSGSNNVDKSLASPLAIPAGSTNGQCSYSQSQRNTNTIIKEDKLVNEGIQIQSSPLARALAGSRRPSQIRSGSNSVEKSLASPVAIHEGSTNGALLRSKYQGNTNASIGNDKLVNKGTHIQSSLVAQTLAASFTRGSQLKSGSNSVNPT